MTANSARLPVTKTSAPTGRLCTYGRKNTHLQCRVHSVPGTDCVKLSASTQ